MVPRFSLVNNDSKVIEKNVNEKQELQCIEPNNDLALECALKLFFDKQLLPGMACGAKKDKTAHTSTAVVATLMYQDGIADSLSYALSDVFRLSDHSFLVQTDTGYADFVGENPFNHSQITACSCSTLLDVVVELARFCGHDLNSIGELLMHLYSCDTVIENTTTEQQKGWRDESWIRSLVNKANLIREICKKSG